MKKKFQCIIIAFDHFWIVKQQLPPFSILLSVSYPYLPDISDTRFKCLIYSPICHNQYWFILYKYNPLGLKQPGRGQSKMTFEARCLLNTGQFTNKINDRDPKIMTLKHCWLLNSGQFTTKTNISDHKILTFKNRYLLCTGQLKLKLLEWNIRDT